MKRFIGFIAILLVFTLLLNGCTKKGKEQDITDENNRVEETTVADTTAEKEENYGTVLSLESAEGVLSVEQYRNIKIDNVLSFVLEYSIDGKPKEVNVTVPLDYMQKSYPAVMYFPETKIYPETDAKIFALNGIISFTFVTNSLNYDLGENDIKEISFVFELIKKCTFVSKGEVFAVGSSVGSVKAFLSAKTFGAELAGVAVADAICDFEGQYRMNDGSARICAVICGGTPEEVPEEYNSRSAVKFSGDILCPVMTVSYTQNPSFSAAQCEDLKSAMESVGGNCICITIDEANMDFLSEAAITALCDFISNN